MSPSNNRQLLQDNMTKIKNNNNNSKKKKKKSIPATPPPPTGKGLVEPSTRDICLGRGGKANHHIGNKRYRDIAMLYQLDYFDAEYRKDKAAVVEDVMAHLRREGFQFVQKINGLWFPAPHHKARAKVIQALREFAFDLKRDQEAPAAPASSRTSSPTPNDAQHTSTPSSPSGGASVVTLESIGSLDTASQHSSSSSSVPSSSSSSSSPSSEGKDTPPQEEAPEEDDFDLEPIPVTDFTPGSFDVSLGNIEPFPDFPQLFPYTTFISEDQQKVATTNEMDSIMYDFFSDDMLQLGELEGVVY